MEHNGSTLDEFLYFPNFDTLEEGFFSNYIMPIEVSTTTTTEITWDGCFLQDILNIQEDEHQENSILQTGLILEETTLEKSCSIPTEAMGSISRTTSVCSMASSSSYSSLSEEEITNISTAPNKKRRKGNSFSEEEMELLQSKMKKPRTKYRRSAKPYDSMLLNFKL